jgi:hypothetical protein
VKCTATTWIVMRHSLISASRHNPVSGPYGSGVAMAQTGRKPNQVDKGVWVVAATGRGEILSYWVLEERHDPIYPNRRGHLRRLTLSVGGSL